MNLSNYCPRIKGWLCAAGATLLLGLTLPARAQYANLVPAEAFDYSCDTVWLPGPCPGGMCYYCWDVKVDPLDINPQCATCGTTGQNGPVYQFRSGSGGGLHELGGLGWSSSAGQSGFSAGDGGSLTCRGCGGRSGADSGGGGSAQFICCPCDDGSAEAPEAMPSWSVVEPHLQLLIRDKPFFYNTSRGRQVGLELHYKGNAGVNGSTDNAQPAIFSVGKNWHSPWRSYLQPIFQTNIESGYGTITGVFSNKCFVFLGDGSARQYIVDTNSNEKACNARLNKVGDEYWLSFPDGSRNVYGEWIQIGDYGPTNQMQ